MMLNFHFETQFTDPLPGPYIAGGRRGQLPPPGNDFAGLFLVAILVRNITKTEFAPADKKS